ncbi:hypothetical protein [Nostoc sp. ChiSLP03a]|uniref:hypothetical protein n=1 Tax=Nostoc sp. ChiSLP03a TaxID=3075380 RepID=UPI002AD3A25A|nr:hypothetical protein [Nostoc sp. ChiSLP03a]MDZ8213991.1 hypothetical protein [Nostoc sp. ChiSLP03a]
MQPWKPSKPSDIILWLGNLPEEEVAFLTFEDSDNLEQMRQRLKEKEAMLEVLEENSKLEKRLRKYRPKHFPETLPSVQVASFIAGLFPEQAREECEEWLGDLYEQNREMLRKGDPPLKVHTTNLVRTAILVLSALEIKLKDLLSILVQRNLRKTVI